METFLFDEIIFGPIQSRRLGTSLGINLLPTDNKFCNFDCIYCECGWTPASGSYKPSFHPRQLVHDKLEAKLTAIKAAGNIIDVITYAGNGEPTLHPDFAGIVEDSIKLRDLHFPKAQVAVLTNATLLHKSSVFEALQKVDQNILKLDSAIDATAQLLDAPIGSYSVKKQVELMKRFEGKCMVQTMFLRGNHNGERIDNTTPQELEAWVNCLLEINPTQVMIYTIARNTPADDLERIPLPELDRIAQQARAQGFTVQVSG